MVRLSKSVIGQEEIQAVTKVLEEEYLGMGKYVMQFERSLTDYLGRHTVCVNTGTSAIQLALQAIDIQTDDEVLVQSLTYVATYQAISATGARGISCEIDPDTLTIDLEDAKLKITDKTKAILPVHYGGGVGNLDEIYRFAEEHNLRVIEDAAHAFGSTYQQKLIGSFGDICCFSFDGIKNITSGEGGAVVTNDAEVIQRISDARLLGVQKDTEKRYLGERSWEFDVEYQGWRYHMSNIMAAIGIEQFKKFAGFKEKRQRLAKKYQTEFSKINGITLLTQNYDEVVPHIFTIQVHEDVRDDLKKKLKENNIQTGFHYYPNHLLTKFKISGIELPLTEKIHKKLITLPLHPDLEGSEIDFIINSVKAFFNSQS